MGFLDSLQDVLAGGVGAFAIPRLQQTIGPDWQAQLDQREFERQRARELAQQQNETFQQQQEQAIETQLANAMSAPQPQGNEAGPLPETPESTYRDLIGPQVDQARRERLFRSAQGRAAATRPALAAAQAQQRMAELQLRGEQQTEQIGARGDEAEQLMRLRSELEQDRTMSPRDRDMLKARIDQQLQLIERRGTQPNQRGTFRPLVNEQGIVVGQFNTREGLTPDQVAAGLRVSPMGAAQQESQVQSAAQVGEIEALNQLYRPEWVGPVASIEYTARERIPGVPQPEPDRATFAAIVANLQNSGIKAITGAQMSEYEVPRLMRELPQMSDKPNIFEAKTRLMNARFAVLRDVRAGLISREEGIRRINGMSVSGRSPAQAPRASQAQPTQPVQPSTGTPQPGEVRRGYRFRGGNPGDQNSWERVQ